MVRGMAGTTSMQIMMNKCTEFVQFLSDCWKSFFLLRMCIWLAQVRMPGAGGGSLVEYYFGKASLLHWTESYWSLLNHSIGPGTLHQPQSRIDIDLLSKGRTSFVDCLQFESMFRGCKYDRFLANCQNLGLWHPASCEYTWNPSLGTFHLFVLCCVWPFQCELWYCYKWYSVTVYYTAWHLTGTIYPLPLEALKDCSSLTLLLLLTNLQQTWIASIIR